jgi:hypothetical protein
MPILVKRILSGLEQIWCIIQKIYLDLINNYLINYSLWSRQAGEEMRVEGRLLTTLSNKGTSTLSQAKSKL